MIKTNEPTQVSSRTTPNDQPIPHVLTDQGLAATVEPWHYVRKVDILDAVVNGQPAAALCGQNVGSDLRQPGVGSSGRPRMMCARCASAYQALPAGVTR